MNLIKFFKINYSLQNLKKSKGILAIMLIVIPVITIFTLHTVDSSGYGNPYELLSAAGINFFGLIVIPFILSNILFGYVYKKTSIDFINSMPINRRNLYFTNIVVGILYILILQLITFLFSTIYILSVGNSLFTIKLMFDIGIAMTLAYTFLYVCSTLALTVSGNKFTQIVMLAIILFTIPFIRMFNLGDYIDNIESVFVVDNQGIAVEYFVESDYVYAMPISTLVSFANEEAVLDCRSALLTLFLTAVYIFVGYKMFDKRKMENTGNSFENEKIHLFVKGITLYPIFVILQHIYDVIELPQLLLIMFVVFVYYVVYDFITIKKIKFKTTCVSFVVTVIILVLISMGLNKVGELTNNQKEYYYANELESMEIRLSELFYGNLSFADIKDESLRNEVLNQLTKSNTRYTTFDETSSFEIIDDEIEYSVSVKCKFKNQNSEEVILDGTIDSNTYEQVLNYAFNNEEFIKILADEWRVSKSAMIQVNASVTDKVFFGKSLANIKDVINKELELNIKSKIQNELDKLHNKQENYYDEYSYYAIDSVNVYEYENFKVKDYRIGFDVNSEVAKVIYNELNKEAIDVINKHIKEVEESKYDKSYEVNGSVFENSNGINKEYASIYGMNVLLLKQYLENNPLPEIDVTKDFYQIDFYNMDCVILVNSIEDLESKVPGISKITYEQQVDDDFVYYNEEVFTNGYGL